MYEIWKDIKEYEGLYQVSNLGRVKSLKKYHGKSLRKGAIIKQYLTRQNYCKVILSKDKINKNVEVQRLVADAFLNKEDFKCYPTEARNLISIDKLEVNHIDENKSNNKVENLEWCSRKYNANYGERGKKASKSLSKKILQYDLNNNFIKEWESIKQAKEELKIHRICDVCKKRRKTAGGYVWKYKEAK